MSSFRRIQTPVEFPISATLFVTYLKCPQQALARIQGIYPESSVALFRGSLAHRILARHFEKGPIPADDFDTACREEAGAHLGPSMAALHLKPSEFRAIEAQVEQLYDRFREISHAGFEGAEVDVGSSPGDQITLKGRVDAVYSDPDGVRVVDWKTGSYLGDATAQLEFYAMAWKYAHGEIPAKMEAISLKTGEKSIVEPTESSALATEESVASMVNAITNALEIASELPRTAGPHCRWCPILAQCNEGNTALSVLDQ